MSKETLGITPAEARDALKTAGKIKLAGWRRSVPSRWVTAGYAVITGGTCATFALDKVQYNYFFFWGLAYVLFAAFAAKKAHAFARELYPPKERCLSYWSSTIGMLIAGLGSIYLRYALDAPWIAVAGGIINGIWLYLYYEAER
ncbi:MAG: hypothetical protein RJS98_00160, partial [Rhodospirillaceae bacterium]